TARPAQPLSARVGGVSGETPGGNKRCPPGPGRWALVGLRARRGLGGWAARRSQRQALSGHVRSNSGQYRGAARRYQLGHYGPANAAARVPRRVSRVLDEAAGSGSTLDQYLDASAWRSQSPDVDSALAPAPGGPVDRPKKSISRAPDDTRYCRSARQPTGEPRRLRLLENVGQLLGRSEDTSAAVFLRRPARLSAVRMRRDRRSPLDRIKEGSWTPPPVAPDGSLDRPRGD